MVNIQGTVVSVRKVEHEPLRLEISITSKHEDSFKWESYKTSSTWIPTQIYFDRPMWFTIRDGEIIWTGW